MAAPALIASNRFFHRGMTKVYAVTTIASYLSAVTRAELNAGIDLSPEVNDVNGWRVEANDIETPDLATDFTGKMPGSTSVDESSITFYADDNGLDIRTVHPRGTSTNIVILWGGDIAGNKMDVFPVRVKSNGKAIEVGDEPALVEVAYTITKKPAENLTVPA